MNPENHQHKMNSPSISVATKVIQTTPYQKMRTMVCIYECHYSPTFIKNRQRSRINNDIHSNRYFVFVGHVSEEFSKVPKDIVLGSIAKSTAAAETLAGIREETMKSRNALVASAPAVTISPVTITKKRKLEAISFDADTDRNVTRYPANRHMSKKFKKEFTAKKSEYTFESIGGIDKILKELCELLLHVNNPIVYKRIGLPAPRGFLLHGMHSWWHPFHKLNFSKSLMNIFFHQIRM